MSNPYEQQLRRELADLRTYRVDLRRQIGKGINGQAAGDALDNQRRLEERQRQLRSSEKRWLELHYLLRINPPGPAIKLDVPASTPTRRTATRTVPSFVTRMINGPGCR